MQKKQNTILKNFALIHFKSFLQAIEECKNIAQQFRYSQDVQQKERQ